MSSFPLPLPAMRSDKVLLATMTNEPFQPVRLYYDSPSRGFVKQRLASLGCANEDRRGRCWEWLYEAEARRVPFARRYEELPDEVHPIVLGRFRFPKRKYMRLDLRSLPTRNRGGPFLRPDPRTASGVEACSGG